MLSVTRALCVRAVLTVWVSGMAGIETEELNAVVVVTVPRSMNRYSTRQVQLPPIGTAPSTPAPAVQPTLVVESLKAALPLAAQPSPLTSQGPVMELSVKVPVNEATPEFRTRP